VAASMSGQASTCAGVGTVGDTLSAPRAATAPAAKGLSVIQSRESLWRPGALNGINAPNNGVLYRNSDRGRQRRSFGNGGGGAIHDWSWIPNLRAFLR